MYSNSSGNTKNIIGLKYLNIQIIVGLILCVFILFYMSTGKQGGETRLCVQYSPNEKVAYP